MQRVSLCRCVREPIKQLVKNEKKSSAKENKYIYMQYCVYQ